MTKPTTNGASSSANAGSHASQWKLPSYLHPYPSPTWFRSTPTWMLARHLVGTAGPPHLRHAVLEIARATWRDVCDYLPEQAQQANDDPPTRAELMEEAIANLSARLHESYVAVVRALNHSKAIAPDGYCLVWDVGYDTGPDVIDYRSIARILVVEVMP